MIRRSESGVHPGHAAAGDQHVDGRIRRLRAQSTGCRRDDRRRSRAARPAARAPRDPPRWEPRAAYTPAYAAAGDQHVDRPAVLVALLGGVVDLLQEHAVGLDLRDQLVPLRQAHVAQDHLVDGGVHDRVQIGRQVGDLLALVRVERGHDLRVVPVPARLHLQVPVDLVLGPVHPVQAHVDVGREGAVGAGADLVHELVDQVGAGLTGVLRPHLVREHVVVAVAHPVHALEPERLHLREFLRVGVVEEAGDRVLVLRLLADGPHLAPHLFLVEQRAAVAGRVGQHLGRRPPGVRIDRHDGVVGALAVGGVVVEEEALAGRLLLPPLRGGQGGEVRVQDAVHVGVVQVLQQVAVPRLDRAVRPAPAVQVGVVVHVAAGAEGVGDVAHQAAPAAARGPRVALGIGGLDGGQHVVELVEALRLLQAQVLDHVGADHADDAAVELEVLGGRERVVDAVDGRLLHALVPLQDALVVGHHGVDHVVQRQEHAGVAELVQVVAVHPEDVGHVVGGDQGALLGVVVAAGDRGQVEADVQLLLDGVDHGRVDVDRGGAAVRQDHREHGGLHGHGFFGRGSGERAAGGQQPHGAKDGQSLHQRTSGLSCPAGSGRGQPFRLPIIIPFTK